MKSVSIKLIVFTESGAANPVNIFCHETTLQLGVIGQSGKIHGRFFIYLFFVFQGAYNASNSTHIDLRFYEISPDGTG